MDPDEPQKLPPPAAPSVFNIEDMLKPADEGDFDFLQIKTTAQDEPEKEAPAAESGMILLISMILRGSQLTCVTGEEQEVDSLLPVQRPKVEPSMPKLKTVNEAHRRREWAHEINVNQPFDNFHDLVPEMAQQVTPSYVHPRRLMGLFSFLSSSIPSRSMPCITWKSVTRCLSLRIPRQARRWWPTMPLRWPPNT